jgi:hypothetical protein
MGRIRAPGAANKESRMNNFLKTAAVALTLTGAVLATAGPASARYHSDPIISIGFGNIAFGYRDGYWDNDHRWHHWRHSHDYRNYRDHQGSNYHDWNHDRDADHGWQPH